MIYDAVIKELIKHNPVSRINLLYYDPCTSFKINWKDKKKFLENLKVWTTSLPAKKQNLITLDIIRNYKFNSKNFIKKDKVLGLHSALIDKKGNIHYWLMLDLNAKPNLYNLKRIKLYISCLLLLLKIRTGGYIIETDKSYHFIGQKCVKAEVFQLFLWNIIKSNGGNGLADTGFCGHTLAKNLDVCLRIQKREGGKPLKVVAKI